MPRNYVRKNPIDGYSPREYQMLKYLREAMGKKRTLETSSTMFFDRWLKEHGGTHKDNYVAIQALRSSLVKMNLKLVAYGQMKVERLNKQGPGVAALFRYSLLRNGWDVFPFTFD